MLPEEEAAWLDLLEPDIIRPMRNKCHIQAHSLWDRSVTKPPTFEAPFLFWSEHYANAGFAAVVSQKKFDEHGYVIEIIGGVDEDVNADHGDEDFKEELRTADAANGIGDGDDVGAEKDTTSSR